MTWIKSSRCDTSACVEVEFRTSSSCAGGDCIEVGFHKSSHSSRHRRCVEVGICTCDEVLVRDSKDRDGPMLSFNRDEWTGFLDNIKAGKFNL